MGGKSFLIGVSVVAVLIFAGATYFYRANQAAESASAPVIKIDDEALVRAHSPRFGNTLARVTVVEWFDPQCEACRMIHPYLKSIVKDYGDRVHFVLRYMPYHEHSMYAASALEELREMGKFEEALDLFFEKQPEWGGHHDAKPEMIGTFLEKFGVPADKRSKDYLISKHGEKVRQDEIDGNRAGVRGTPSFFVNGAQVTELGDKPLRSAIDEALKKSLL